MEKNTALHQDISAIRSISIGSEEKKRAELDALSKNILDYDLGRFSDSTSYDYELDDTTRDRLIAHARQDTALACLTASRAVQEARNARNIAYACLIILLAILYKVW
jgi:hypothetical protein